MTRAAADRTPIAPVWHTALLVLLFVAVGLQSAFTLGGAPGPAVPSEKIRALYLPTIAVQLMLLGYVSWPGARLLRELKQGLGALALCRELAGAGVLFVGALAAQLVVRTGALGINPILPSTAAEKQVWVALALSAGIGEELVFRGYLQRQAEALSGKAWLAILFQAVLFAAQHGYQGARSMLWVGACGALWGAVARISGNLRTGIFCHCALDLFALVSA